MNIQIFGTKKCNDTKKRNIENMINWDGKDKDTLALIKYIPFRYTFRSASSNAS